MAKGACVILMASQKKGQSQSSAETREIDIFFTEVIEEIHVVNWREFKHKGFPHGQVPSRVRPREPLNRLRSGVGTSG
jgi:GrpB-like predicted nucleotidyltransferase (UPF0157 family)